MSDLNRILRQINNFNLKQFRYCNHKPIKCANIAIQHEIIALNQLGNVYVQIKLKTDRILTDLNINNIAVINNRSLSLSEITGKDTINNNNCSEYFYKTGKLINNSVTICPNQQFSISYCMNPINLSYFLDEIEIKKGNDIIGSSALKINSGNKFKIKNARYTATINYHQFGNRIDFPTVTILNWTSKQKHYNVFIKFNYKIKPGYKLEQVVGCLGYGSQIDIIPLNYTFRQNSGTIECYIGKEFDGRKLSTIKKKSKYVVRAINFYFNPLKNNGSEPLSLDKILDQG